MRAGKQIAGFTILAELGKGAASTLFAVQDPKTKQVWALKHVVKNHAKDQRFLDQTEIENLVGQKLNHRTSAASSASSGARSCSRRSRCSSSWSSSTASASSSIR
jgi:serine/threonine protein kinase